MPLDQMGDTGRDPPDCVSEGCLGFAPTRRSLVLGITARDALHDRREEEVTRSVGFRLGVP